jgi:glutathionyl-hydroquinone reductase
MQQADRKDVYGNTWESEVSDDGEFVRHQTSFRDQIRADGSTDFSPASGCYHLYVSYACPWAHRTLTTRKLKGLDAAISFDVVSPLLPSTGCRLMIHSRVQPETRLTASRICGRFT